MVDRASVPTKEKAIQLAVLRERIRKLCDLQNPHINPSPRDWPPPDHFYAQVNANCEPKSSALTVTSPNFLNTTNGWLRHNSEYTFSSFGVTITTMVMIKSPRRDEPDTSHPVTRLIPVIIAPKGSSAWTVDNLYFCRFVRKNNIPVLAQAGVPFFDSLPQQIDTIATLEATLAMIEESLATNQYAWQTVPPLIPAAYSLCN